MLIELRQAFISYQDYHMLSSFSLPLLSQGDLASPSESAAGGTESEAEEGKPPPSLSSLPSPPPPQLMVRPYCGRRSAVSRHSTAADAQMPSPSRSRAAHGLGGACGERRGPVGADAARFQQPTYPRTRVPGSPHVCYRPRPRNNRNDELFRTVPGKSRS